MATLIRFLTNGKTESVAVQMMFDVKNYLSEILKSSCP